MHVVIVNRHLFDYPGGSENQCHELATQLSQLGHSVTYAACYATGTYYDVPYRVVPLNAPFGLSLLQLIRRHKADVLYWRFNKHHLLTGTLVSKLNAVPFVFAVSHINDMKSFAVKPSRDTGLNLLRLIARRCKRALNSLIAASNALGRGLATGFVFQHSGQVPKKLHTPYEIIFNSYEPPPVDPFAANRPYVLWVSNIKQSKNPEKYFNLANDLQDTGIDFRMVGALQDSAYADAVRPENLPPGLDYMGYQDQKTVDSLIRGSLFVAHTCSDEGFPNVFLQAWLQGRPVVSLSFDPGGLLVENAIGLCSGNYDGFVRNVRTLLADEDLRRQMGDRALSFALENCNRRKNVEKLVTFLKRFA